MATIVLKLFNIVAPNVAVFGEKDYQQLVTVKKMVSDLNLPIEIAGVETKREADGLAMSSRNSYLSSDERKSAACIPRALEAATVAARKTRSAAAIIEKAKKIIENEPQAVIEYIKVCDPLDLKELEEVGDKARMLVAVRIGKTRLIDNCPLTNN